MTKVYQRTENGTVTLVSIREGLAEVNHAMLGGKRAVRRMSSGRGQHLIEYKDGRTVRLAEVSSPRTSLKEWCGTASNPFLLHRFGEELRASCNRGIRSRGAATLRGVLVGQDNLRSLDEVKASEHAELYTFCPRCMPKSL